MKCTYKTIETEKALVRFAGKAMVLQDDGVAREDYRAIGEGLVDGTLNFNKLIGFYRVIVVDKTTGDTFLFGDNAGSLVFYYTDDGEYSDSLLELARSKDLHELNKCSVAQVLNYGCIVAEETLISGVKKTNSEYFYLIPATGGIGRISKALQPLSTSQERYALSDLCRDLAEGYSDSDIVANCTGGTDSRAVLACLHRAGKNPDLMLTGHDDNPDITIAREIAEKSGKRLKIVNPEPESERWLDEAFEFSDGNYDVVLSFRFLKKARGMEGYRVCFGGVGGEFYKNHFYKPYVLAASKVGDSTEEVVREMYPWPYSSASWLTDSVKHQSADIDAWLVNELECYREQNKSSVFNRGGLIALRNKFSCITNPMSQYICQFDPLMEPLIIRSIANRSPASLSMHMWQREVIHEADPVLSGISTDQGYSCSVSFAPLMAERARKAGFWASRVIARSKRKLGLQWKDVTQRYWDKDYAGARELPEWGECLNALKDSGVLEPSAESDDVPMSLTGWVMLCGLLAKGWSRNR